MQPIRVGKVRAPLGMSRQYEVRGNQMRFAAIVVVLEAGLMMTAVAQRPQKPKGKPSHSEERESNKKSPRIGKDATHDHTSAAQELRRVEQSSKKVAPTRKSESAN